MSKRSSSSLGDGKVRDIRDWLQRYAKFSERLFKSGSNFDDQQQSPLFLGNNIELQSSSPQLAEDRSDLSQIFDRTGFVCRSVIWQEDSSISSHREETCEAKVIGKYSFLSDWERLWNYLADEDSDEIAVQLPFLRAATELVFHHRMVQLMYFLFLWNICLLTILTTSYHKHSHGFIGDDFISVSFEFAVYLLVCVLNRGANSIRPFRAFLKKRSEKGRNDKTTNETDSSSSDPSVTATAPLEERELAREAIDQEFPLSSTLRRIWRRGKLEARSIFFTNNEHSNEEKKKSRKLDKRHSLFYYRWINIALKVLTRDYDIDITNINFNRRFYRFPVFCAITLYPIYVIITDYIGLITVMDLACSHHLVEHSCAFYTFQFIFSGLGFTFILNQIMYGSSVILALSSLAYGGEIAFRLAECWTQKYHSLRRIELQEQSSVAKIPASSHSTAPAEDTIRQQQQRRRSTLSKTPIEDSLVLPQDSELIQELLTRDASEHYLFICELLQKAGELWSPVLTLLIFLALYICLADVIYVITLLKNRNSATEIIYVIRLTIFVFIRVVVLLVYPILSIAFANSYFTKLYDVFKISDVADYELIGGRDRWLATFKDSPAAWTFFGVAITPGRLFAVFWTALVALGGVLLSAVISDA